MKKVFQTMLAYHREHYESSLYLKVGVLVAALLAFNYSLDFEDEYIDAFRGSWLRVLWYFLYLGIPFLATAWLLHIHGKAERWFSEPSFWILFGLGFFVLAMDRSFFLGDVFYQEMPKATRGFWYRVINWSSSLLTQALPLILIYEWVDKQKSHKWYGLIPSKFNPKPYLYLLLIAGVFIGLGSFFGDIQSYYPRYKLSYGQQFTSHHDLPSWISLVLFESSYATNFITVELFFRGFLIYAFTRYFGTYAILPMVVTYCVLHFGKPLTESLSSIVGGYALGILALHNRNIWGGVIIHVGVAWLMELFGYLQKVVQ